MMPVKLSLIRTNYQFNPDPAQSNLQTLYIFIQIACVSVSRVTLRSVYVAPTFGYVSDTVLCVSLTSLSYPCVSLQSAYNPQACLYVSQVEELLENPNICVFDNLCVSEKWTCLFLNPHAPASLTRIHPRHYSSTNS